MSTMLFSYITTYKVPTRNTPYQLMYGLHPLMPIEYIVLLSSGYERNNTPMKVLIGKTIEFKKLQEARMQAIEIVWLQQWNETYGINKRI